MKIVFIVLTIMIISVWLCAGTKTRNRRSIDESSHNCVPGTRWRNDCNNCFCTETGVDVCTKKGCFTFDKLDKLERLDRRRRRSISESTRSHNEYDNIRLHHPKNNIDPASERKDCVPGSRWRSDCNSCWCTHNGVAACTMMACLNLENNALKNQQHRQPVRVSAPSRNSIFEDGDKHARIRRSVENEGSASCIPGTHWRKDCNTCLCSDHGFAACTYRVCLQGGFNLKPVSTNRRRRSSSTMLTPVTDGTTRFPDAPPPENENKCKHGTTWMNDCNRCRCFRGHSACTRMMCPKKDIIITTGL